jgi:hypothetical protein
MDEQTETFWGDEIEDELVRLNAGFFDTQHDDRHTKTEWLQFIDHQLHGTNSTNYRRQLIKIAALAVAAVKSYDRLKGNV